MSAHCWAVIFTVTVNFVFLPYQHLHRYQRCNLKRLSYEHSKLKNILLIEQNRVLTTREVWQER